MSAGNVPVNAGWVENVRVITRPCANPDNDRGRRTFEWRPWQIYGRQRDGVVFENPQVTVYYRGPHEVCGAHAHRGDNVFDPDRNPEEVFFISGLVSIDCEDLWGDKRTIEVAAHPGKPVSVVIPAWILHTFRVGDFTATYIEVKRRPFSQNPAEQDLVSIEEFRFAQQAMPS